MTAKRPNSIRHLDDAIRRECGGDQAAYVRLRTLMANAVVARMLPDGVVKGGSAIKMRYGNARTRYTTDLDTATATDPRRLRRVPRGGARPRLGGLHGTGRPQGARAPEGRAREVRHAALRRPARLPRQAVVHGPARGRRRGRRGLGRPRGRRRGIRDARLPQPGEGTAHTPTSRATRASTRCRSSTSPPSVAAPARTTSSCGLTRSTCSRG